MKIQKEFSDYYQIRCGLGGGKSGLIWSAAKGKEKWMGQSDNKKK